MTRSLSMEDAERLLRSAVGTKIADRELGADVRFEELGLTSLDLVEVLFAVEEHLGMELEPIAAKDPTTLGELLDQINAMVARPTRGGATT